MRKLIVLSFITLDGVMQAPGGPEEDTSVGFKYGGWAAPYFDDVVDKVMEKQMKSADLLLGRKTFEIFASYWPDHADNWPGINDVTKYVMSKTMKKSDWKNSVFLKSLAEIEKLKNSKGSDIQVHGSSELIQLLLKNDLVDELWLKIHPLTLGKGKKLFDNDTTPAAFTLTESVVTPTGVIIANYKRSGKVKTGTIGAKGEIKREHNRLSYSVTPFLGLPEPTTKYEEPHKVTMRNATNAQQAQPRRSPDGVQSRSFVFAAIWFCALRRG